MTDTDPTEVLAVVASEIEANLIADTLRGLGIHAEASGGLTAGFRAEAPGAAKVLVRRSDLTRARAALEEHRQTLGEIDWDQVDVGEMTDE